MLQSLFPDQCRGMTCLAFSHRGQCCNQVVASRRALIAPSCSNWQQRSSTLPRHTLSCSCVVAPLEMLAAPELRALFPSGTSAPRQKSATAAVLREGLQPWQVKKLQAAHAAGRRNVKIQELCRETQLERREVLEWMKEYAEKPAEQRQRLSAVRDAAEKAAAQRRAILSDQTVRPSGNLRAGTSPPAQPPSFADRQRLGGDYSKKRLSRSVVMTLEKVYDVTDRPSEDLISDICDLHPIPRQRIVDWFEERRLAKRRARFARLDGAD